MSTDGSSRRPIRKHPALKVSLVVSALLTGVSLIGLLPYYGYCSVGYADGYISFSPLLYIFAVLGFMGWTGADIWTWMIRAPDRDHWAGSLLATLVLILIVAAGTNLSSKLETTAIERFTERMEPTVSAIEDHVARHGSPPRVLTDVVTPPDAEICSVNFAYEVEETEWGLELTLVESAFRGEWIRYRSDRQFKDAERVINGWGWGRWVD